MPGEAWATAEQANDQRQRDKSPRSASMLKRNLLLLILGMIAITCMLAAQSKGFEQWVGVWEGQLEGQPGVTITLGRDAGELQGTIVFNVVARENGEAA